MAYLITGGAGFIGSQLARALLDQNQAVVILDSFDGYYDPALKRSNVAPLLASPNLTLVEGDIRDRALIDGLFERHPITHVAHLAALSGVRASVSQTPLYMDVNTIGTMHLLEASARRKVELFILASTSSVYGETERVPFVETDTADRPLAPYPASKRAAEILAYTYHHLHGIDVTVLRFFNVYGPAGRPDMMPMQLMNAAVDGRLIKLFNNGDIYRDWTYISDTVDGILRALDRPLGYEIINLGFGSPISMRSFVDIIEEYSGRTINTVAVPTPPSDPPITYCDSEKAQRLLGVTPKIDVREGLWLTWEWFRRVKGL